jgi:hypothetical protein
VQAADKPSGRKIKQASDSGCAVQRARDNQAWVTGLAAESKSQAVSRGILCARAPVQAADKPSGKKIKQASDSGCAVQRARDNQEWVTVLAAESKCGKRMESTAGDEHWVPKPTCTTEITNKTKTNLGGYAGEDCREVISVEDSRLVLEHEASPARGPEQS